MMLRVISKLSNDLGNRPHRGDANPQRLALGEALLLIVDELV